MKKMKIKKRFFTHTHTHTNTWPEQIQTVRRASAAQWAKAALEERVRERERAKKRSICGRYVHRYTLWDECVL